MNFSVVPQYMHVLYAVYSKFHKIWQAGTLIEKALLYRSQLYKPNFES